MRRFNKAIFEDLGIDNLICVIAEPTLESDNAIFSHRDVAIIHMSRLEEMTLHVLGRRLVR